MDSTSGQQSLHTSDPIKLVLDELDIRVKKKQPTSGTHLEEHPQLSSELGQSFCFRSFLL